MLHCRIVIVYFVLVVFSPFHRVASRNELMLKRRLVAKYKRSPVANHRGEGSTFQEEPFNEADSKTRNNLMKTMIQEIIHDPNALIISKHNCELPKELPKPPPLICLPHELAPFTTTGKDYQFYEPVVCGTIPPNKRKQSVRKPLAYSQVPN